MNKVIVWPPSSCCCFRYRWVWTLIFNSKCIQTHCTHTLSWPQKLLLP